MVFNSLQLYGWALNSLKLCMMERDPIIPTRIKSKTPRTLSYPIGAEAISDALRGVSQFDQLRLEFRYYRRLDARGARPQQAATTVYDVIAAAYSGPRRFHYMSKYIEEQFWGRRWEIVVHAVPRSLRHAIQARILAEALPAIRCWLVANPHAGEREGWHQLGFSFDELENKLTSKEAASVEWQTERADR